MSPPRLRSSVAAALGLLAFIVVALAQRDYGVVRDETTYRHHGKRYASWWIALVRGKPEVRTAQSISAAFGGAEPTANNREHPPLMKTLYGLSTLLLHEKLGWTSETTAVRLPAAALNGLLVALVTLFAASIWGLAEGIVAGALTLLLPRAFFHAGLATLDGPITALWFATLFAYYRALRARRFCVWLGLVFGLALATKHNALLLPIAILAHYAGVARRLCAGRETPSLGAALWRAQPLIGPALLIGGPLVLAALWPWLWFDTVAHVADWLRFHFHHVHYNFEYLGKSYQLPPFPWHVPVVTTLLTVPTVTLVAGGIGVVVLLRRAQQSAPADAPGLLLFASAAAAMLPFIMMRDTPIFGAEKHWAPAIPSICIAAGVGTVAAARLALASLASVGARRLGVATLATFVIGAAAVETRAAYPYALTHYTALAGGAPGGADLGMNRQFWGYAARGVLPWLSQHVSSSDGPQPVFTHDASPAWPIYRREGLLAANLPDAGADLDDIQRSNYALVIYEQHFRQHEIMIWRSYKTLRPAYLLTTHGVPIVAVYARPAGQSRGVP